MRNAVFTPQQGKLPVLLDGRGVFSADSKNLSFGKLVRVYRFTVIVPQLIIAIFAVFLGRTRKQVRRVDARGGIARMAHEVPRWYVGDVHSIHDSVRAKLTVPRVSVSKKRALPYPAASWLDGVFLSYTDVVKSFSHTAQCITICMRMHFQPSHF